MYPDTFIINKPDDDLATLKYAQAGVRFTTTLRSADIGLQYYYGRLNKPAATGIFDEISLPMPPPLPSVTNSIPIGLNYAYNPYHQIGIDWAQVILSFNVRAEVAANITEDLSGDDGSIYNPSLLWSFGFDRELVWGINLNLQCNETIRLMNDKINNTQLLDTEADIDMISTQIMAAISKKFFRDQLEIKFTSLWEIEARDYLLMPSIIWTKDAVSVEFSGGIFGGNEDGQFGQYRNNNFVKAALIYSF